MLIHDRTDVSPELLQTLKQEILAVISEHVIIDEEEGIEVTVSQTRGHSRLRPTSPLLGMRRQPWHLGTGRGATRSVELMGPTNLAEL